mgnify:CR=1 FL=1
MAVEFTVEASYLYDDSKEGWSAVKEERIRGAVGHEEDGSGCGYGERRLYWTYKQRFAADAAANRIRDARIPGVRVSVIEGNE